MPRLPGLAVIALLGAGIAWFSRDSGTREGRPDYAHLSLHDAHGNEVRLGDYRGRPVMLHFFTTWCTQCDAMVPAVVATRRVFRDSLQVVGVSLDLLPEFQHHDAKPDAKARLAEVNELLKRHGVDHPVLFDHTGACASALSGHEVPVHVVFDSETRLLRRFAGTRSEEGLQAILEACVQEDRERRTLAIR